LAGCDREASSPAAQAPSAEQGTASSAVQNPQGESGDIPDPCTLFSDAEVMSLIGRDITQIDRDGADAAASTRYCQWQQSSGQLVVFISRSSTDDFKLRRRTRPR
jgi:Protein of unknown function (DUF3558)